MREISYLDAIQEALRLAMESDPDVILIGEDVAGGAGLHNRGIIDAWGGAFGTTKGLVREFGPGRVIDMPISESAFLGMAVGAAATGLRPIVDLMFVDFVGVCADQLFNQAAKLRYIYGGKARVPLTIKVNIGAGLGAAAFHSQMWTALFAHIPGVKCIAPSTPYDAKGMLTAAIRDDNPVVFCEHKLLYSLRGTVPEAEYSIPVGTADVKREGRDITIVTYSYMVHIALAAAERLAADGISAEVVDLRSLSPLDEDAVLRSVDKTGRLVIVDEDTPRCSVASDIAALVAAQLFYRLEAPIETVTAPDTPVPFSRALERVYLPNAERVEQAVHRTIAI